MARILVIDDDEMVRETIGVILGQAGHCIENASSGREGVHLYQNQRVDLVIIDMHMPEQNGVETIMELQRINPAVKTVLISGGGETLPRDKLYMTEVLQAVKRTFTKPLDSREIVAAVKEIVEDGRTTSAGDITES